MSDPTEDLDTMQRDASRLRQDPVIRRLLRRMPKAVALSFNADQLYYLRKAIYKTSDKDGLEYRVFIPFLSRSLFVRIVYGINRRKTERSPTTLATKVGTVLFYLLAISVVLVCLYLIKSFMGIDLFHSFSMEVI